MNWINLGKFCQRPDQIIPIEIPKPLKKPQPIFKEAAFSKIFRSTKVRVRLGRSETVPGQFSDFSNASLSLNFGKEFEVDDLEGIRILGGTWFGTKLIFWRFQLLYLQAAGNKFKNYSSGERRSRDQVQMDYFSNLGEMLSNNLKDLEYFSAISLFFTVFKTSSSFSSIGGFASV